MAFRLVHQISCNIKNTVFTQNTSTRRFRSLSPAPRNPDGLSSNDHQPCEIKRRRSLSCCKRDLLKSENIDVLTTSKQPLSYDCNQYGCEKYCDTRMSSRSMRRNRDVSITSRYFSRVDHTEWIEDEDEASTSFEPELIKKQRDAASLNKQAREKLNQYRLRDSVPVKKRNVYEVYDHYMKDYTEKDIKVLPHLQPNRLKPYGKGQSMVFPFRTNRNRAIKYPIMEPGCGKGVPTGYKPKESSRTNVSADKQKRDYSTKSDHDINSSAHLQETSAKMGLSHTSHTHDVFRRQDNIDAKTVSANLIDDVEDYSTSSEIEKCNQVINDFKKINPGYRCNKRELKSGSTEEKEALASALNFVAAYKQHYNNDVDSELQKQSVANEKGFHDGKNKPFFEIKVGAKANLLQGSAEPETLAMCDEKPSTNNVRLVSPWPSYAETCKPLHHLKRPLPILYPSIMENQGDPHGSTAQSLKLCNSQPKLELSTRSMHRINNAQELRDFSRKDATKLILSMSTNSNGSQDCFFQIPPNSTLYQPILNTRYRSASYQNIIKGYSKKSKILEDPPRATENFKSNDCLCVEQQPPLDVPPLKRLKKRLVYELPKICATKERCPPRADENLIIKPKQLRTIIGSSSCHKVCAPMMEEGPALPRLVKMKVNEPKKECPKITAKCPPRADGKLKVKRKSLPSLTPGHIPCAKITPLSDVTLQRLPKFSMPDSTRLVRLAEECPPRADEKLKINRKSLPKLKLSKCGMPKTDSFQDVTFKRLNKFVPADPPRRCRSKREIKITRADDSLKPIKKSLPTLVLQKCPRMEPEPLKDGMPLVHLKKRCQPEEHPRVCDSKKEKCPPRADDGLVFKPKKLPPIVAGFFKSRENALEEGCPLPRLRKKTIVEPKKVCPPLTVTCAPRSDSGLEITRKQLPRLELSNFPKVEPKCMTDAPPLRPLPKVEINESSKICVREEACVVPRADDGMVVQSKKLPLLRRSSCPCVESKPLKEVNFARLKKFEMKDPPRVCPNPEACDESQRADAVAGYKFVPKELPPMILKAKNNRVSTRNFTKKKSRNDIEASRGRKFSTISNTADDAVADALKGTWRMLQDISSYTYNLMKTRYYGNVFCSNLDTLNSEHLDKEKRNFATNADNDLKTNSSPCLLHIKSSEVKFSGILESINRELSSRDNSKYLIPRSRSSPSLKDKEPCIPKVDISTKLQQFPERQESVNRNSRFLYMSNTHGFDQIKPVPNSRTCGNSIAGTLKRDSRLLHVLANNGVDKVKYSSTLQEQKLARVDTPKVKSVLKYFSSSCRQEDGLRSIATEYRPFLNPLYKNTFKLNANEGIQAVSTSNGVKNNKLPVFPTSYKKYFQARYFSNPLYSNAFYPNRKAFNTSAALLKRKTSRATNKAKCTKIKMSKCKPRARKSCTPIVVHKKCTRSKSPYPAFSECGRLQKENPRCECHPLLDKKVLQPRYPIVGSINIQKPPPPEHELIDEEKEIKCLQDKLEVKEEKKKENCMDIVSLAHAQCEVEAKESVSHKKKNISCKNKLNPGKDGEYPKVDVQTCRVKEFKLPAPERESCESPKKPSTLGTKEKTDKCSPGKSTKMYIEQPCDNRIVKKGLWERILDYFKPRPNCPSPGEYKARKLREKAEKAAKAAGLKVCTPCDPCKKKKKSCAPPSTQETETSMEMPSLNIFKVKKYSKKKPPGKGKKPSKPSSGDKGKGKGKGKPKGKGNKRATPPTLKGVSKVKKHSDKFHQQMAERKPMREDKHNFSNMFPPNMPESMRRETDSVFEKCSCDCPCSRDCTCNCSPSRIPMEECMIQTKSRRDPCKRRKKRKSCSRSKSRERRSKYEDDDDCDRRSKSRKRRRRSRSKSKSRSRSRSRKRRSRSRSDDCRRRSKSRRKRSKSKSRSRSRSKSRKRRRRSSDDCKRRSKSRKRRSKSKSRGCRSKSRKSRSKSKKSRSGSKSKDKGRSKSRDPCKPKSKSRPPCKPRVKKDPCKPKPKKAPPCKSKLPTKKPQLKKKAPSKSKLPSTQPKAKKSPCKSKKPKPNKSPAKPKPNVKPVKPKPKKATYTPKPKKKCKSEGDHKVCPSFNSECPPRVRKSCEDEYKFEACEPQIAPYPSFSECHPPFPKIKHSECTVAGRKSKETRSIIERNRRERSQSNKSSSKEQNMKKGKRPYSTMSIVARALGFNVATCWRRNFSSNSNGRGPKHLPQNLIKNEPTKVTKSNKALNQRLLAGIEEGIEKLESQNTNLSNNSYYKILKTLQKFSEQEIAEFFEEEPQFNPFMPLKDNVRETISYVCKAEPRAPQTNLLDPGHCFETRCLGIADINAQMEELKVIEAFRNFCNNLCTAQEPEPDFEEKERRKTKQMRDHLNELLKNSKQPY